MIPSLLTFATIQSTRCCHGAHLEAAGLSRRHAGALAVLRPGDALRVRGHKPKTSRSLSDDASRTPFPANFWNRCLAFSAFLSFHEMAERGGVVTNAAVT